MGIFTQIADSLDDAQTVAVIITKVPTGDIRVTITDPNSRGESKFHLNGTPQMIDTLADAYRIYGIEALAALIKAAVNKDLSKVIPDENRFEIREENRNNYYKQGAKGHQINDHKTTILKGDVLMRQRKYEEALLMYQSALSYKVPKKRQINLQNCIARAEENIAFMKEHPDGFIKNPLPPKNDQRKWSVKAGFTIPDPNSSATIPTTPAQVELNLDQETPIEINNQKTEGIF